MSSSNSARCSLALSLLCASALVFVAGGCYTFVHIKPDYTKLPVDAVKAVALAIEQAVQKGEREPALADQEGVVVSSEIMKQAIRTRAARAELMGQFLDSGFGYEGKDGLVYVLRTKAYKKATTARQRDRDAVLVMHENADRWAIYEDLIDASHIAPKSLSAVQEIFYQAHLQCLREGQKYENEAGEIVAFGATAANATAAPAEQNK